MESKSFKLNLGDRELTIEIKNLAEQANGSAFVRYGDTLLLSTCVMSKKDRDGLDFFPLTVEYEERFYAAGKIKGPKYIKREGRPTDTAIILGRIIDRAVRPCFNEELRRDVQIINTCLSWDGVNEPGILGLIGTSIAIAISDVPWTGPVGVVRVGKVDDKLVLNPTYEQREKSEFDLVIAGLKEQDDVLINMIESDSEQSSEEDIIKAIEFGKKYIKEIIEFQEKIIKEVGKKKIEILAEVPDQILEKDIKDFLGSQLENALFQKDKVKSSDDQKFLQESLVKFLEEKYADGKKIKYAFNFWEKEINRILHENAIKNEKRADGRKIDELREISGEVNILPRTHGSGLFMRGQTKALSILTLGAPGDQQILEGMEIVGKKRFMHHYNFPPYCSGEVKPVRGPGRREIGHGMLAEKALLPLIPSIDEFPYTIRIVTEIMSSNGSTSMASVCASTLALMDAGVPIKAPAAGISIGLMSNDKGEYKILTDIQGPEDHYGDMDFKVAGTRKGITAIQLDVKIKGLNSKIIKETFERAKKTREQLLDKIEKIIPETRKELSQWAPRIIVLQINPDKIRDIIGPGGKVINEIIAQTGVAIDIEDSGKVFITAEKEDSGTKAVDWIKSLTREVKVGEIFQGKVKRILTFGAFVELFPGQEGMVHISQLAPFRVNKVEDIVKIGDTIPVKVITIDEQGRINLSLKDAKNQEQK